MARVFSSVSVVLALAGCGTTEFGELQPANLDVSTSFVEFGTLSESGIRSKTISITNTGDVPLGIESIELEYVDFPDVPAARLPVGTEGT